MRVIALIDESDLATSVTDYAAWVAKTLDWDVDVVHVNEDPPPILRPERSGHLGIDTPGQLFTELVDNDEQAFRKAREIGYALLQEATARLHTAGISSVREHLVMGTLADHLTEHRRDIGLVVMGKRGESGSLGVYHIGSHVERVIRATHIPIIITPGGFRPIRQIVFAWDGRKSSGAAIEFLIQSGLLRNTTGQLIYVGEEHDRVVEWFETAASHLISAGMIIEPVRLTGNPAHTIVDVLNSDEPDLLVMGAYGHSRLVSKVLGSTTTHVLQQSQVATLVFH